MEEPRAPREQQEAEVTAALPVVNPPEPPADSPRGEPSEVEPVASSTLAAAPETPETMEEEPVSADTVFDKLDREVASGMSVGDGFRFGCGFVLALAIGILAFLIVLTAFFAVGTVMGFKLPF